MKLTAEPAAAGVSVLRDMYSDPLRFLLGIAGLVLLITCANLASLMLARTTARERDLAVRLAIGAGRWRLIRLVLGESLLLAVAGAVAGAALAQALSRGLVAYLDTSLVFRLDWRLFAFLLSISLLTCLLFGLGAALRASRTAPDAAMKTGGRDDGKPRAARLSRRACGIAGGTFTAVVVQRSAVHPKPAQPAD